MPSPYRAGVAKQAQGEGILDPHRTRCSWQSGAGNIATSPLAGPPCPAITCEADIVGIMVRTQTLNRTDGCGVQNNTPPCQNLDPISAPSAGNAGGCTIYSYASERGLQLGTGNNADGIEDIAPRILRVIRFATSGAVDEVRILIMIPLDPLPSVPDPARLALFGLGLLGRCAFGRRR